MPNKLPTNIQRLHIFAIKKNEINTSDSKNLSLKVQSTLFQISGKIMKEKKNLFCWFKEGDRAWKTHKVRSLTD